MTLAGGRSVLRLKIGWRTQNKIKEEVRLMKWLKIWSPRGEMQSRRDEMDLFEQLLDSRFFDRSFPMAWDGELTIFAPRIESYVDGDKLVIKADLPGVDPKKLDVSVEVGMLTIRG